MKRHAHEALSLLMLLLAALACASPIEPAPDTAATLNAVSTLVQQTLAAQPAPPTLTPLPPPTIGPSATPLVVNPTLPPTRAATPSPSPSLTPVGPRTRPNGALLHAARAAIAPTIDGQLSEWPSLPYRIESIVYRPENWSGVADQSAAFAVAWDANFLYLAVRVTDDAHVQTQTGELIFRGDSLELLFDADLAGDFDSAELSADDFQLGLSPGDYATRFAEAYLWFPQSRAGALIANVAVQQDGNGYALEAALPWATWGITPRAANTYGFALSTSDNDTADSAEQQSLVSSSPTRRLTNPTTWGTLVLDE